MIEKCSSEASIIQLARVLVSSFKSTPKDQLNWKGYYGIRNMGDIVEKYGTKSQYRLYRLRVRIAWFRNRMLYALKRYDCYRFNYNLYNDALNDMKNNKFGYNERYHA